MADAYWMYAGDPRVQVTSAAAVAADPRLQQAVVVAGVPPSSVPVKRPRPDFADVPGAPDGYGYYPREIERMENHVVRDTNAVSASYDRYLRNGQVSSYGASGLSGYPFPAMDNMNVGFLGGRSQPPLPADASNTLYVEGLPANITRREVSHIFRPFVGFQEVRLVNKESRLPGGDQVVLCFVDFTNASHASVALDALQGYRLDLDDRDSAALRLQFARFPGPRSGGGSRGRR